MAVKVRCPTCEKVLNAPDTARGKAVKCPACETKIKVPVGGSAAGDSSIGKVPARKTATRAPAKKRVEVDSGEFLAGLDLDKAIDSSESMCPKCGAPIPEDAPECPKCGVDPATGQLSAAAKKRLSRKGKPDPALFYSAAWKDSWEFTKQNYRVALRTAMYFILYGATAVGCGYMSLIYCETLPPQIFWGVLSVAASLALPGWVWCLTIYTIRVSAAKKSNIREIHFDIFQNIALGVKTILWYVVFCWIPLAGIMYPLAMIHMAMPVTKRGWINFLMLGTFFRNFMPTVYVFVVQFVLQLAVNLALAPAGVLIGMGLPMTGTARWVMIGLGAAVGVLAVVVASFALVFNTRVIGLLAYYFQDSLDLVTFVSEKTYVRKEVKLDAFGTPIKSTAQKVGQVLFVLMILGVIVGVGFLLYYQLFKKN